MSSANLNYSYNFSNNERAMSIAFKTLIQSYPTLLSQINYDPSVLVTNTKYEWLEDSLAPTSIPIGSFVTDGDGEGIVVSSTAGFSAGSIIGFEAANGASKTESAKISSIDSTTQMTIARDYGGSSGVLLIVGDIIKLISKPRGESTDAGPGTGREPGSDFNHTQIFDGTAQISKTQSKIKNYGFKNQEEFMSYQREMALKEMMFDVANSSIYGRRVARSGSEDGTMGGILQYLEGGNVTDVGGAVTTAVLNGIVKDIYGKGGFSNNYAFVCAEDQATRISDFNAAGGANSPVRTAQTDREFGGYITNFTANLPVQGGFKSKIIVDPLFPKDQIAVLDLNLIQLRALQPIDIEDATLPAGNYIRDRVLGELTLEVQNGKKAHGLLTGLTI
jgi:hypothetical protein